MTTQYPSGFWPAMDKYFYYFDLQGTADVLDLRNRLKNWRCPPRGLPQFFTDILKADVAALKEEILKAAYDGDLAFIEKLTKAMRPDDPVGAVKAVLIGFENLFSINTPLPTMAAVKRQAIKILKEKGKPIPRTNHWSRIFTDAGLSDLPHGRPGRPSKQLAQK